MKHPIRKELTKLRNYLKRRNMKLLLESEYEARIEGAKREGAKEERERIVAKLYEDVNVASLYVATKSGKAEFTVPELLEAISKHIAEKINAEY